MLSSIAYLTHGPQYIVTFDMKPSFPLLCPHYPHTHAHITHSCKIDSCTPLYTNTHKMDSCIPPSTPLHIECSCIQPPSPTIYMQSGLM